MSEHKNSNRYSVAIIIPVFNGEKYIRNTIMSCIAQDYPELIIVVVDDYSSDSSLSIIEEFSQYSNLFIYKNNKNIGLNKTINNTVEHINADILLLLGHDDLLPKSHLSKIVKLFDDKTSLVFCNALRFNDDGEILGSNISEEKSVMYKLNDPMFHFSLSNFVSSTGTIIDRRRFQSVGGFNEKFKNYGEWLLWINISKTGSVKFIPSTFAFYRRHSNNISNSFHTMPRELLDYFKLCRITAKDMCQKTVFDYNKMLLKYYLKLFMTRVYRKIFKNRKSNNQYNVNMESSNLNQLLNENNHVDFHWSKT